jgi:hypothetical protein
MKSQASIKRDLDEIKARVLPKPPREIKIRFWYPFNKNDPHGTFGGCLYSFHAKRQETIPEEQEIRELREYYENDIPEHCKQNLDHVWSSFEKYMEYYRCKCGNFGHFKD